ncbi:hypothetical protein Gotri_013882 [Gossypium trilobum]|uniref:Uncharacterized protein n=1 Tax=Gossypium trilobum TaxID=34281 RepID=A0A7J9DW11_9ROSI|nr:hypothetical protein [Gossypium trilobum]
MSFLVMDLKSVLQTMPLVSYLFDLDCYRRGFLS